MGTVDDEKDKRIGEIISRAERLAFQYRLIRKDKGDWLRDGGYRDHIYRILSRLTLPELEETEWSDEKIQDVIELVTRESSEPPPPPPSSQPVEPIEPVSPTSYISDLFDKSADRNLKESKKKRNEAQAELYKERAKELREKRNKPLWML